MPKSKVTTAQILEKTLQVVAPLPSQMDYMRNLATILAMHINRNLLMDEGISPDELPAPSAIIVAPTGQGKTFLLRKMAESMELNLIIVDCGTLVGEGYKGVSLSQRISGAVEEAKNEKAFSRSLLFLDKVDKLCGSGSYCSSGMISILQLFNGGSVAVSKDDKTAKSIDVSRFMILLGGAFVGLEEIIRERISPKARIGFDTAKREEKTNTQWMQEVTAEDLAKYGIMWELLGRIGTILVIPQLGLEDYKQLLNAQTGSIRKKYDNYFMGLYGVHFAMSDVGVDKLSEKCMTTHGGARAVNPLIDDLVRSAIVKVEEDRSISTLVLDADNKGYCIRCEHGERAGKPVPAEKEQGTEKWHIVKAKSRGIVMGKRANTHIAQFKSLIL